MYGEVECIETRDIHSIPKLLASHLPSVDRAVLPPHPNYHNPAIRAYAVRKVGPRSRNISITASITHNNPVYTVRK
jgi:hypothetical protein